MKKLKIRTLKKGWHDKDEILLHATFQILIDFVEKEKPDKIIDWNADTVHKQAWSEICELYKWWKKLRPARKSSFDDRKLKRPPMKFKKIPGTNLRKMVEPNRKKYSKYYKALGKNRKLEKQWHGEDQQNLHRIIEIRPFLWT
jgi:hypothetical protein